MAQEIAQLDELKLKPLSSGMQPRKSTQTDIGEVQVTRTIFGGVRVRVVRRKDRVRRAWLLAAMLVSAALVAIQQGWIHIQQAELRQNAVTKLGWSIAEPIKSLAAPPVSASLMDAAPAAKSKPAAPPQPETRNTHVAQQSASSQQLLKAFEEAAAKPAASQPPSAPKPQAAAFITAARPVGAAIPTSATIPVAVTTSNTATTAPPAASSPATNTPPIAKAPSPDQEAASSSTADTPSATKALPPRLAATNISAVVAPPIVEPPSAQSTVSVIQPEKLASEPGKSN